MTDTIDTSGRALVDHWKRIVDQGRMNSNTASALRAACSQVLECLDGWETLDVRSINVNDAFRRFQDKRHSDFKPQSMEQYKRRFAQAVQYFLDYCDNPSGWRAPSRVRSTHGQSATTSQNSPESTRKDAASAPASHGASRTIEYPYPLKGNRMATLKLPVDITLADVRRLSAFMATLAVDFEPGGD